MIAEKVSFFYKFLKSPRRVGSVTPSSKFLAQAMLKHIDWSKTNTIVELGAGTGAFTKYIYELKQNTCKGIIYEQDPHMQKKLRTLYPEFHYCRSAENIYNDITTLGLASVDSIISGLPFANFPQALRDRIMEGVLRSLRPGGSFIAFQYSKQMLDQFESYFSSISTSFVPLNIPPAFVYYCKK